MTDRSKRERLQFLLDSAGYVESDRYGDRQGQHLVLALGEARGTLASGTFYRMTSPEQDPLRAMPARVPGRFHSVGEATPAYMSTTQAAAMNEMLAHLTAEPAAETVRWYRGTVTAIEVDELPVLDLTDSANLQRLGMTAADVLSPEWQATQRAATFARDIGAEGIIAPSRVSPEAKTLVVFDRRSTRLKLGPREIVSIVSSSSSPAGTKPRLAETAVPLPELEYV